MGTAAKACLFGALEIFLLVTPMMFPTAPLWVGVIAWTVAAVLALTAFALWIEDKGRTLPQTQLAPMKNFGVEEQRRLSSALKACANEHAEAEVHFASNLQWRLAERIAGIFSNAGWKTNLNSVRLEAQIHHTLFEGVEVFGYNSYIVNAVANALISASIADVKTSVVPSEVTQDNPKWGYTQNRVRITVGHKIDLRLSK